MISFKEYILEMKMPDKNSGKGLIPRIFNPNRVKRLKKALNIRKSTGRQLDVKKRANPDTLAKWSIPTWKERGDMNK